jgi:hypothetical protein
MPPPEESIHVPFRHLLAIRALRRPMCLMGCIGRRSRRHRPAAAMSPIAWSWGVAHGSRASRHDPTPPSPRTRRLSQGDVHRVLTTRGRSGRHCPEYIRGTGHVAFPVAQWDSSAAGRTIQRESITADRETDPSPCQDPAATDYITVSLASVRVSSRVSARSVAPCSR